MEIDLEELIYWIEDLETIHWSMIIGGFIFVSILSRHKNFKFLRILIGIGLVLFALMMTQFYNQIIDHLE
ncbi:MAG: hypothetical protein MRY79_05795 [Alphaproteobacteria bacterium]|nr:hypothetical protein [Alphaproteobacteria bacterium]